MALIQQQFTHNVACRGRPGGGGQRLEDGFRSVPCDGAVCPGYSETGGGGLLSAREASAGSPLPLPLLPEALALQGSGLVFSGFCEGFNTPGGWGDPPLPTPARAAPWSWAHSRYSAFP